jgi:hypothetical protein
VVFGNVCFNQTLLKNSTTLARGNRDLRRFTRDCRYD